MNTKRVPRGWFDKQGRRRSIGYRPRVELLEDRLTPAILEVPLDPFLDQFGNQFEVVQIYRIDDGLGDRVTFGIFDTGASPVTFGWSDQLFFELVDQAIPVLPGVEVTAEGVGGSLTGLVSQPGMILADGLHALDLEAFINGQESIDLSGAAAVDNVQAMIGTDVGSPNLPSIVGTPIVNGRLPGSTTDGVAVLIDQEGYFIDFGALFPEFPEFEGLILPLPDLTFVAPGTLLTPGPETTEALRVPIDFIGIDNHLDPGMTLTESYNPVVHGIQVQDTSDATTFELNDQVFLFDTGAQVTVISTAVALALGLDLENPETTIEVGGAGGNAIIPGYTLDELVVPRDDDNDGVIDGTLHFTNVPVFVLDVDPSFDGILGMNLVNTAAQFLYDPHDPDGAGPAGPSLQFTFSTALRDPPDEETLGALDALFPAFAGSLGGQSVPGFDINHAPSVAADEAAVTVQEGQEASNAGTFIDLDGDPIQISTDIGDVTQNGATWSWSLATTDGPVDPVTVTITANDGHGGARSTTFTYAVENVPPTIAISGAGNVNEGDTYTLTLDVVTDPGDDTITDYIVNWGDGNSDTYSSVGAKTHTYADGPNGYAITVDLVDEDDTFLDRANALSVTVDNVVPTPTIEQDNLHGLYVDVEGRVLQNIFLGNEKWIRGETNQFGNTWYFILPDGKFFEWSGVGNSLTGNLLADFDAEVFLSPELLYNAATLTLDTAGTAAALALDNVRGLHVDSNGFFRNAFGGNEKWLRGELNPFGNPWYFLLPDGKLFAWNGVGNSLTGSLLADFGTPNASLKPELIYQASQGPGPNPGLQSATDQAHGLTVDPRGFLQNIFGGNEKWLSGTPNTHGNTWYFILPDGRFFAWNGAGLNGTLIATFNASVFLNLELLYDAFQGPLPVDDANQAQTLDSTLGLYFHQLGLLQNAFGGNERWVRGELNQFGNIWYFILPTGQVWEWNGSATLSGEMLFDPESDAIWRAPELLTEAAL